MRANRRGVQFQDQSSNSERRMEGSIVQCPGWRIPGAQGGPRGEGEVSIECLQSSEFVVGKQANFNGAVTIINCADAPWVKGGRKEKTEEKIVIKDKVVTEPPPQGGNEKKRRLADLRQTLKRWRAEHTKLAFLPHFLLIALGALTMVALALFVLLPKEPTPLDIVNSTDSHPFYSKEAWKGKPATSFIKMKLPVPYVVVSHTVTPLCYDLKACASILQNMQEYHLRIKFADIAYNFLLDSSGGIYEGRGWERRNVAGGFINSRNVDVALIGDFSETQHPSEEMMAGLKYLVEFGVAAGKVAEDYSLLAANTTYSTLSPGKNVYKVIKGWPHFDPDPKAHIKE